MSIQEREIEIQYINKILERLSSEGDTIYMMSPAYTYDNYSFVSSAVGRYDPVEEERLEEEALKWRKSDQAKRYIEIVERIAKITIIRDQLQKEQEDLVIKKYELES